MFNLLLGSFTAVHQIGAFVAALVCAGLGGLIVGNAVYWRLHAIRVQGQVIGVRQVGTCFNAVYRYTLPSGQSQEATSIEGSGSVHGRETGSLVPLLVIPEKPGEVDEAGSHVFTVVGMMLLAAGAWIFSVAVTQWQFSPMTWIVASLLIGRLAFGVHRIIRPKDKRLASAPWRDMFKRRSAADGALNAPVRRIEDIVSLPENRAKETAARASNRRVAPILLIAGLGLLVLGVYLGRSLMRLESSGLRASGVVQSIEASNAGSRGMTYYPVVGFSAAGGTHVRFRDSVGSNPPSNRAGDTVAVLYLPDEPAGAIIDRGLWNGIPSLAALLMGCFLIFVSVRILRRP